ncbi:MULTISPECIES: rhodanese-like domain-containing protein [unclassified Lebetimonas]|uniref:rhodanese-like domain-containing protein n=1 Tax=unclassified Lebetimonas TaxID=2648158 RepID=UPI000466DD3C|nr:MULTISPECIES: rhodanese-like domain-containing protein [unclassified Lebetimonas]
MTKYATPKGQKEIRISLEEFKKEFNEENAVLIDIRMPFEKKVWNLPFAIDIPANELENRLNELPKDKLIVTACPENSRAAFAAAFLKEKGYNAKFLAEGLLELMKAFKGGKAKELKVD